MGYMKRLYTKRSAKQKLSIAEERYIERINQIHRVYWESVQSVAAGKRNLEVAPKQPPDR